MAVFAFMVQAKYFVFKKSMNFIFVTVVEISMDSLLEPIPFLFEANHPFIFTLIQRDEPNRNVIFLGRVIE